MKEKARREREKRGLWVKSGHVNVEWYGICQEMSLEKEEEKQGEKGMN